ncbi:hypothetical protein TFLX_01243 [Thermoflexales bacterium]|nr:hypothetical protein TFLX_01243 [Thermoflexales bacterium]
MSNLSSSQPAARAQARALPLFNRSLWLTLLFALGLIAALLFIFSARTIASPSETTISQRFQNSGITGAPATYGTYGEVLTVTMRFTVTNNTVLTGPITITTRFAGVVLTPNNQLGFRFLGYQDPVVVGGGAPPLAVTSFTSSTSGVAPNITTILNWSFDTINNTSGNSYVYELPYQIRFVGDGIADTAGNAAIPNQGGWTYITWYPYNPTNDRKLANSLTVNLAKPDLSAPAYSSKTAYVPSVEGGATVAYTITLKNGTNAANFITAQELFVTDSLDARLTYVSASPAPNDISSGPGQDTILTWTTPGWTLAPNATWMARVTATLPSTFAANTFYTNTVVPSYSTLPGTVPDEFEFTPVISAPVKGGILGTKVASPLSNVRIGDAVTYTIRITINPNVYLNAPIFTDTLPVGFRYRAGTFSHTGATLNGSVVTGTSGTQEQLIWKFMDIPLNPSAQVINVSYVADVTGLNVNGSVVYAPPGTGQTNADNAVAGTWQTDTGVPLKLVAPLIGRTTIAQPYFNSLGKTIKTWPLGNAEEIGSQVNYEITLINNGTITGYEVVLNDMLPPGMVFKQTVSVLPANLVLLAQPAEGAVGTVQWIFQEIPRTTVRLEFSAIVSNTARPGDTLSNTVSVADYTSQPGTTHPYDRHYGSINGALPVPARVGFVLKGLNADKFDSPDPVLPNQTLLYRIVYSNSSVIYPATGVMLLDHYDPWLTFQSATVSPTLYDPINRNLTWNVGTLPVNSGNSFITATFTVAPAISRSVRVLTNTITSDSASPAPAMTRIVTTTLIQPKPTIMLDDQGAIAQAGKFMTYTLIYSNATGATGATTGTFTITLGYADYVSYTAYTATPAPTPPGPWLINPDGSVFTDTLGPGASRTIRLRMLVDKPLPYTLAVFTSTATISDRASDAFDTESENTPVAIPVFTFEKVNTTPGNPPLGSGQGIGYRIFVTNTGSVTATNIIITDVWDANTYNQNAGGSWTLQPTQGVYATIATLGPGQGQILDPLNMNVTTTLPPNAQLIHNIARLTSAETSQQETSLDTPLVGLFVKKSHDPNPVYPGELLTYTIVYTAYAPAITQPYISDTLPSQVTYQSCSGGESCTNNNGVVTWNWPNGLDEGDSGTVTVTVLAPNTEGITLTNIYASNGGGINYREGPPDLTYVGRPHTFITKRATTAVTPIAPGDQIVYTLNYTNSGSYKATGVQVFDQVPANTTFVSCSGVTCNEANGTVTWDVGEVPAPSNGVLSFVVQVNPTAGTTTIVNGAYSLTADRNVANENTPPAVNTAVVRPALTVVKSATPSWIALMGEGITYTVRYTNTGGGTFTTLLFTDTIDGRLTILGASPNCAFDNISKIVTCTDTGLAPTQAREFSIRVRNFALSNNEVVANFASYLAANQTEVLPEGQSNTIETPASNTTAAADFVGTPISGGIGLNVIFTNMSGGSGITSCTWDFGDGQTSTTACQPGNTLNHIYNQSGTYTVKLTIVTGGGSNVRTRTNYITISGTAAYGVQIASPQPLKRGNRGSQVIYTVVVTNTGTVPDTFTLSLPTAGTYQWVTQLGSPSVGPLAPQQSANVQVTVFIPAGAPFVASDTVTITATSISSSSVSNSVVLKTSTPAHAVYLPLIMK